MKHNVYLNVVVIIILIILLALLVYYYIDHNNKNTSVVSTTSNLSTDLFGRVKTAEPFVLASLALTTGKLPDYYSEKITAGATSTYVADQSVVNMSVTTTGDKITRQTIRYNIYQPGKSLEYEFTFNLNANNQNGNFTSRAGGFDDDNGFFFEYTNGKMYIVKRTSISGSVVETKVEQKDWNINQNYPDYDFSSSKVHIGYIELQWLGVGSVIVGVRRNREEIPLHHFKHAGLTTTTYTTTGNFPVRYEIESTGGPGTLRQICSSVTSEGGYRPNGSTFTVSNVTLGGTISTISTSGNNGNVGLLQLSTSVERMLLLLTVNNTSRHANVIPKSLTLISPTSVDIFFKVYLVKDYSGTILTGGAGLIDADATNSVVKYARNYVDNFDKAFSGAPYKSEIVKSGFSDNTDSVTYNIDTWLSNLVLGRGLNGPDYLMITVQSTSGGSSDTVYGSVTWEEIF